MGADEICWTPMTCRNKNTRLRSSWRQKYRKPPDIKRKTQVWTEPGKKTVRAGRQYLMSKKKTSLKILNCVMRIRLHGQYCRSLGGSFHLGRIWSDVAYICQSIHGRVVYMEPIPQSLLFHITEPWTHSVPSYGSKWHHVMVHTENPPKIPLYEIRGKMGVY